jgi:diaminopimelate decarboxylase
VSYSYRNGVLHAEEIALDDIARRYGTPCYVYSRAAIASAYGEFSRALQGRDAMVCYSVKANSNLAVLALLARLGAGFDIVSGGELARVLAAGGDPGKTLFSGVGKSEAEIGFALDKGIGCINVESEAAPASNAGRAAPAGARRSRCGSIRTSIPRPTPTSRPGCARASSACRMNTRTGFTSRPPACPGSRWSASAATSDRF